MTRSGKRPAPQWSVNIKEMRNALRTDDRARVSQERLSDMLQPFHPDRRSVSQTTVGKWEAGLQEPTVGEFEALAALARERGLRDVSPEWLAFNRGTVPAFLAVLGPRLPLTESLDPDDDEEEAETSPDPLRRAAGEGRSRPKLTGASSPTRHGKAKRRPRT
jgi:hypothetical protein